MTALLGGERDDVVGAWQLLDAEGAERVDRFLAGRGEWAAEPVSLPLGRPRGKGWRLSPFHDGTDGFFIAGLFR